MLRRHPENILINSLSSLTVVAISGGVTVEGYGDILAADLLECYVKCADDCVPKEVEVVVVIPDSCECPYEWTLTVKCKPDGSFETQETFPVDRLYSYVDPAGGVPTEADTADAIAAYINADPNACVTATSDGVDTITLIAKDCEHNFDAYTNSGTVTVTVPHTPLILTPEKFARMFPIKPGSFGSTPQLTNCGDYCIYHFKMRSTNDTQDISAANHYLGYEREVNFVVNSALASYVANWKTEMFAAFSCLNTNSQ